MERKLGIVAECLGESPENLELIKSAGFEAIFGTCILFCKEIIEFDIEILSKRSII